MGRPIPSPRLRRPFLAALAAVVLGSLLAVPSVVAREDEWGYDPRFRRGPASDTLHVGRPPLRRADVDAYVDLLQVAFGLALPTAREQPLRDAIENAWESPDDRAFRQTFLDLVRPLEELRRAQRGGEAGRADEGLRTFRRDLDRRLADAPLLAPHQLTQEILRLRGRTVWAGAPPIHGAAAEAWLDLVLAIVSFGRNEDVKPTAGQRAVLLEDLGPALAKKDPAVRRRVLDAWRPWLRLQAAWDEGDELRRLELRYEASKLLARALPEDRKVKVGEGRDLTGYARDAGVLRDVQSGHDAWSNLGRHPEAVLDVVEGWLRGQAKSPVSMLLVR